jgi:hypothetical protein
MKKIHSYNKKTAAFIKTLLELNNPSPEEVTDAVLRKLRPTSPCKGFLGNHSRDEIRLLAILKENDLEELAVARSGKPWRDKNEFYAAFKFTDSKDFSRHWRAEQVASKIERMGHEPPLVVAWLEAMSTGLGTKEFEAQVADLVVLGWSQENILQVFGKNERTDTLLAFLKTALPEMDLLLRALESDHPAQPIAEGLMAKMMKTAAKKSGGMFPLQPEIPGLFGTTLGTVGASTSETLKRQTVSSGNLMFGNGGEHPNPGAVTSGKHQSPPIETVSGGSDSPAPTDLPPYLKPPVYLEKKGILRIQFKGQGSSTTQRADVLRAAKFEQFKTRFAWERSVSRDQVATVTAELIASFNSITPTHHA